MKKLMVIVLTLVMLFTSFSLVSCKDDNDTLTTAPTNVVDNSGIDENYLPELSQETNYDGKEFVILSNNGYWEEAMDFESDSEDPVDSAVYKRNRTIESRYGVKIKEIPHENPHEAVQTAFKSGTNEYHAVVLNALRAAPLATEGMFQDLESVENLNLNKYYWDQSMRRDLSVEGKSFFITGDLFTRPTAGTFLILFNKKIQNDYSLPDFYEKVKNNTWTIDYMTSIVNDPLYGYQDDGNGMVDIGDKFSFAIQEEVYVALFYAIGGRLTSKSDDDLPVTTIKNETNMNVIDKVSKLTNYADNVIDTHEHLAITGTETPNFASVKAFFEGRALFFCSNASNLEQFREMDDDFGVLPLPLKDSSSEYTSFVYNCVNVVAIPTMNVKDLAFTGFVLEALAAESYKVLTPAYYDQTLKGKYQRDPESYEMIDIACRNRVWDFGYICDFGGIYGDFIGQLKNGTKTFTSFERKIGKKFQTDLNNYIKAYQNAGEF